MRGKWGQSKISVRLRKLLRPPIPLLPDKGLSPPRSASTAERPNLIPVAAPESVFALAELGAILPRLPVDVIGDTYDLRLSLVAAARIASAALVIGQVQ